VLERRALDHGIHVLASIAFEELGFLAVFTERGGGVSDGPFASLNLGLRAGDAPNRAEENRRRVCSALGVESFACGRQVHGNHHESVPPDRAGAGFTDPESAFPSTDALETVHTDVPIAILTADCLPIALADEVSHRIAVVHAGWRGLAAGIVGEVAATFEDPGQVIAAIGPAVGVDHYEVSDDVVGAVSEGTNGAAVVHRRTQGSAFLNLEATAERTLRSCGVHRIEAAGVCTACEPERFFSYRRDGVTGRQALIAARLA
jgi:hypothetical protein